VYDNLGLETVWNRYQTVLVSDAGAPFGIGDTVEADWVKQTLRALDVATDQARGLRKRSLVDDFKRNARSGTYCGIDTRIANHQFADALPCAEQTVQPLAKIRTRLNPFNDQEQEQLINWATRSATPQCGAMCPNHQRPDPAGLAVPAHSLG
jgi:NTE family protein